MAAAASTAVEPANALTLTAQSDAASGWRAYQMTAKTWGRSRVTVTYADGSVQTIHYYVTKPASQAVGDMGTFLTSKAWFVDASDPFGRSPSVMTYDHELGRIVRTTALLEPGHDAGRRRQPEGGAAREQDGVDAGHQVVRRERVHLPRARRQAADVALRDGLVVVGRDGLRGGGLRKSRQGRLDAGNSKTGLGSGGLRNTESGAKDYGRRC